MSQQIRETITLAIVSLLIAAVAVGLILTVFLFSGHENLLKEMLQSTAEGKIEEVAFTAGGPFGMWVIAFLMLRFAMRKTKLYSIKLFLRFPDSLPQPPVRPTEFRNAKCWYVTLSNGQEIDRKDVTIQTDQIHKDVYVPYIYVEPSKIENPEFQVFLEYESEEWLSDSYSPKKGSIDLR